MKLLTPEQQALIIAERNLLMDLRVALVGFGAAQADQVTLEDSIKQLDDFFLLVVVGEFNAGKSAFINALIGKPMLKEGVTPTTTQINVLKHGEEEKRIIENEHLHVLTSPSALLENLSIVDTPGTNAIIREHEAITTRFVPRADMVLFVTSADRPFSESERSFLAEIRDWGKKVVIVLNKIDILQSEADLTEIREFIRENALILLGSTPEIFPVSARLAFRAKQGEPQFWEVSRFALLESYIANTLDESSRIQLKFLNPLGVADHLAKRYLDITEERLELLQDDFTMLADVEAQLKIYEEDMNRDFNFRMSDIEKILYEMENRGQEYFDETIRVARVLDLLRKDRIQREFEHKVIGDVPQRIESKVAALIDWLVESDLRQWQAVTEYLAERRQAHKGRIVGDTSVGTFHYDRERLIEGVGREANRVVETYDRSQEARQIAEGVQTAVAAAAVLEVGAVGLGVLVTAIATTVAVDVTGILMASVIALLGVFVIPARRRQAKNEMREKITKMRDLLNQALRSQFEQEIGNSLNHIQDAVGPYTRFVRAEQNKLKNDEQTLTEIKTRLEKLKAQIHGR